MKNCLFCNISEGKIPADIVFQDDKVLVIQDIQAQAPTHLLIIPKRHIATINETDTHDQALLGHMMLTGKNMAQKVNIAETGYRLVFNVNPDGGQAVFHIHLHLLGGRPMHWPPG